MKEFFLSHKLLIVLTLIATPNFFHQLWTYKQKLNASGIPCNYDYRGFVLPIGLIGGWWGETVLGFFLISAFLSASFAMLLFELIGRHQKMLRILLIVLFDLIFLIAFFNSYAFILRFLSNRFSPALAFLSALIIFMIVLSWKGSVSRLIALEDAVFNRNLALVSSPSSSKRQIHKQLEQAQERLAQFWFKQLQKPLNTARQALQKKQWRKADHKYHQILKKLQSIQKLTGKFDWLKSIALAGRAQAALERNRNRDADSMFSNAVQIVPWRHQADEPEIQAAVEFLAVQSAQREKMSAEAVDMYLGYLAFSRHNRNRSGYREVCSCLEKIARIDESKRIANDRQQRDLNVKILQHDPSLDWAHHNLGLFYFKYGQYGESERHFQNTIRLNPSAPTPYYYLGKIALEKQEAQKAEQDFRTALRRNEHFPEAHFELGKLLLAKVETSIAEIL